MATTTRKTPLADELVYHILSHLSPHEIVCLRPVSKYFDDVTRDRQLWLALYTQARLPRPSGPFEWQTTRFLERTLVGSELASRTWTSRPTLNAIASIYGPRFPSKVTTDLPTWNFIMGRLFVWCEETKIFTQDLDTGERLLLWNNPRPIPDSSVAALSMNHQDGERVYIAFFDPVEGPSRLLMKLLEFPVRHDANRVVLDPVSFETHLPGGTSFSMNANFPYLWFDDSLMRILGRAHPLLIDVTTHVIYTFPPFKSSLRGPASVEPDDLEKIFVGLSRTHILVSRDLDLPASGHRATHIQAFVLPLHPSKTGTSKLRFSHETLVVPCVSPPTHILRDSIVDLMTGHVHIRFLGTHQLHRPNITHFSCIDVTLAPTERHATRILPIGVHEQPLFRFEGHAQKLSLQNSDEGLVRGLVMSCSTDSVRATRTRARPTPRFLYRFSIDASGEGCTGVLSEPEELRPNDPLKTTQRLTVDGPGARVCYDVKTVDMRYRDLVVADFR